MRDYIVIRIKNPLLLLRRKLKLRLAQAERRARRTRAAKREASMALRGPVRGKYTYPEEFVPKGWRPR